MTWLFSHLHDSAVGIYEKALVVAVCVSFFLFMVSPCVYLCVFMLISDSNSMALVCNISRTRAAEAWHSICDTSSVLLWWCQHGDRSPYTLVICSLAGRGKEMEGQLKREREKERKSTTNTSLFSTNQKHASELCVAALFKRVPRLMMSKLVKDCVLVFVYVCSCV